MISQLDTKPVYDFRTNWVDTHTENWKDWLSGLIDRPSSFLEIGCWEGRSAIFWLENILTHPKSHLSCLDRFFDSIKERRFDKNLAVSGQSHRMTKLKGFSNHCLRELSFNQFDGIYIDGSHEARDVLTDAVLCWPLLRKDGVMIFDDYHLPCQKFRERPTKEGVDYFLDAFRGQYEFLCSPSETRWQVAIQKP